MGTVQNAVRKVAQPTNLRIPPIITRGYLSQKAGLLFRFLNTASWMVPIWAHMKNTTDLKPLEDQGFLLGQESEWTVVL